MKKSSIILFLITVTYNNYSNPNLLLKSACIISAITAGSYAFYNDYRYTVCTYHALQATQEREQLITRIANNPKEPTPDPAWWLAKLHHIIHLREEAAKYRSKGFLSRLITLLLRH